MAEYLLAEVLERQPEQVRRLLLRTSIFERVTARSLSLLTGDRGRGADPAGAGGRRTRSWCRWTRRRSWFRYHHLFADLLRLELRRAEPDEVAGCTGPPPGGSRARVPGRGDPARPGRPGLGAGRRAARRSQFQPGPERPARDAGRAYRGFPSDGPASPERALLFGDRELTQGSLDSAAAYLSLAERHAAEVPDDRKRRFRVVLAVTRLTLARRVATLRRYSRKFRRCSAQRMRKH